MGLWVERTQESCVLHIVYIFTWECFTGVFHVVPMVFTVHIPACRRRPSCWADRFLRRLPPQFVPSNLASLSFINDAIKSEFGKCIIKLDQDFCWILLEYLAIHQMYDCRGEILSSQKSVRLQSLQPLGSRSSRDVGRPDGLWGLKGEAL